ncbi:hypothetical protein BK004_01220 [bacterium CG10_46_32]|nr:MAG: hypothetical protein BK004_01220 [bacterium CG10_46_32]
MLSTDVSILAVGSEAQNRMKEYGSLADRLAIVVCTTGAPRQEFEISNMVRAIPTNSRTKILYAWDILRVVKQLVRGTIDVITAQDPFETGLAGWLISRRLKSKLQLQVHTDFLSPYFRRESFKNRIRVLLAKWLLAKADSIRVVSERIKQSLIGLGLPEEKIVVLPIFVDVEKIQSEQVAVRAHKKYPQFDVVILMVSRLEPEKNITLALRAFAEVARKHSNTGLVILGAGSQETSLKQLVVRYQLQSSVVFEGAVQHTIPYYQSADIFLNTSNYEGYGRTLIEAAASGCPIITTDVGVVGERINKDTSLVVPVGDSAAVEEAMSKLITDEKKRNDLGRAAQESVQKLGDAQSYLEQYKQSWQI